MRSYTPPPSVQAGYDIGAKLDPGTPGDKREVYRQGARLNTAAGLLAPPIGAAQGLLDLEHATHGYKTGEGSLTDVAMAAPGALGIAGKLPRLRGGYHGTSSPEDFSKFIKSQRDVGTHISTDPNVARGYAMGDYSPNKFLSDWATINNSPPGTVAGLRAYPVVADIRNPMRYPGDPINWQEPANVLGTLEFNMGYHNTAGGPNYPKLLKELDKLEAQSGHWKDNFPAYLKEKGYDAIQYPHVTKGRDIGFNSFMALDPEQVLPKFSPEGIALAKERGVIRPQTTLNWNPMDQMYWDLKHQGIPQHIAASEAAAAMQKGVKLNQDDPYKNIASMLSEEYMSKPMSSKSYDADLIQKQLAGVFDNTPNPAIMPAYQAQDLYKKYSNKEISKEEYQDGLKLIWANPPK
jgi:hypothetical protein